MMLAEKEIAPDKSDKIYHAFIAATRELQEATESCRDARRPNLEGLRDLWMDFSRARSKAHWHYLTVISARGLPEVHAYAKAINDGNQVEAEARITYKKHAGKWVGSSDSL